MSWLGFNTAVSGLLASQRRLYVTNHNIANANAEGYSRQVATQNATSPHRLPGIGFVGTGTNITSVERVRDSYLDYKFRTENAPLGEWEIKRNTLVDIEHILKENGEEGLSKYVDQFFGALEDLSKNPGDDSYRVAVREKAVAMTNHLNETATKLYNLEKDTNYQIGAQIKKVNDIGSQIKNLNEQIYRLELDGNKANDLRDQRDLLVSELSKIVNVQVSEQDGKYKVSIGGASLVEHSNLSKLKHPPRTEVSEITGEELAQVEWENGNKVALKSGELKGLLDVRDGTGVNGEYGGIPYYVKRLDEFAKIFAEQINKVHKEGYNANGVAGGDFFEALGGGDIRADNISIAQSIKDSLDNIAAGRNPDDPSLPTDPNGIENNKNILELIKLRESKTFFSGSTYSQGTPEDYATSIISTLGVSSQYAIRMKDNQALIVGSVETRIDSVSSVDPDEEMADMVRFMKTYTASAKMISTLDALYDITVNRLGLVGR
ncbi:flagellar hook-associated protein FlgK [Proteiniborus sp. MB09-C3]|uniref:flagellar hook-associated protein FlgK n=1 Tax=Proteiniborus sp. MB09-C3 TaxID=3050072 RepID=UPI002553F911|nr:flagellar hook-associated protein FlgK [Proteiniborus sp. MB09-C3]WIV12051.1 flagellar hook-associated protein FlgK [Proteiniborus sp. MB09-C3]